MNWNIWFILLFITTACGSGLNKQRDTINDLRQLEAHVEVYKQLAPRGWDHFQSCDALLFASLHHAALGEEFGIQAAEASPGQWFRKPEQTTNSGVCSSDISRDMFHGLLTYALKFQKLQNFYNTFGSHMLETNQCR